MKTIKRMAVSVMAFVMIVSMFSCVAFTASATSDANWNLTFTNENGETVTSVEAGETFYISVGLKDYSTIGEMTLVTDEYDAPDYAASSYNNVITAATAKLNIPELVTVDTTAMTTPYATATLEKSFIDGVLTVITWSDKASAGLDYAIGAAELAANNGVLFTIKAVAGETVGTASFTFNEGASSSKTSVATINKDADVAFSAVNHVATLAMGGYDATYDLTIDEETPAEPVYDETFKPASVNVEFESDYTIRFTVKTAVYDMYNNVYMVVNKAMYDGDTAIESQVIELKNPAKVTVNGEERYAYIVEGFAAKEMSSQITATLCGEDENGNVVYGKAIEYSLRQYAQSQITKASTSAEFKTMMVDFLNYGAAAQIYFGYNTTDLANTNLTEEQLALGTADRELVKALAQTDSSTTRSKFSTVNLEFESKITIRATTNITGETYTANKDTWYAEAKYTNYLGEETIVTIPFSDARIGVDEKDRTYIDVNALAAREMSTPVEFTVYDGDGAAVTNTLTYSIETYAASKANGTNVELATLVKAMMKFGDGAKAYFEAE